MAPPSIEVDAPAAAGVRGDATRGKGTPMAVSQLWRIHGRWYDLTTFMASHPGGAHMLALGRGRECTELFESAHSMSTRPIRKMLRQYEVVPTDAPPLEPELFEWLPGGFYETLSARVRDYFKERGYTHHKATWGYWVWMWATIAAWAAALVAWLNTASVALGGLTGLLAMSWGIGLFHTASHAALSSRPWINHLWSQLWSNWHFSYYTMWMQHHVYGHHCYTGIHRKDPDLGNSVFFVRKHPKSRLTRLHRTQHIHVYPVMLLLPNQWVGQILVYIKSMLPAGAQKKLKLFGMPIVRWLQTVDALYFAVVGGTSAFVHIILPLYWHGMWFLPSLAAFFMAGGITYWVIVFPNHDTEESSLLALQPSKDWGKQQVQASLSFGQPHWLSQFWGGMNYQIEHHLFPSVHPVFYPEVSRIVQQHCREQGVPYPYHTSWFAALRSYGRHAKRLATELPPSASTK